MFAEVTRGRQYIHQSLANGLPDVAFWSLLLPVTVGTKTSDILRGYFAQRLLWEVGGVVGVYPPLVNRKDTLKYSLAEAGFWDGEDVELTAAWLRDLVSVGYSQQRLMALELDRNQTSWSSLGHQQFLPHAFPVPYLGLEDITGMASQVTDLIRWRHFFGNIVLVLECVGPTDHTVLGWRMFYGRLFKHIVVLGKQADEGLGVETVTEQSYKKRDRCFQTIVIETTSSCIVGSVVTSQRSGWMLDIDPVSCLGQEIQYRTKRGSERSSAIVMMQISFTRLQAASTSRCPSICFMAK